MQRFFSSLQFCCNNIMIPQKVYLMHNDLKYDNSNLQKWNDTMPDYTIIHVHNQNAYKILEPLPEIYTQVFHKIKNFGLKADFLRFVLLYERGGYVASSKLEPLCDLDIVPETKTIVLAKNMEEIELNTFNSDFMGSVAKHPIMKRLCYAYINHFLEKKAFFSQFWKAYNLMDMLIQIKSSEGEIAIFQQVRAHFFYDACFMYKKKRVLNDKEMYFESSLQKK